MRALVVSAALWARRRALAERRRGRGAAFVGWTLASGVVLGLCVAAIATFTWSLVALGLWWLAPIWVALVALVFLPWETARHVAVPLGWPKLAFHLGAESFDFADDRIGGGLIAAAWAACRQREPDPDALAWIEGKRDGSGRLGDCRVIATALIAEARGDRDGARALMESVALLPEVTPPGRELAAEWLAVDDAGRGEWRRILARAPRRVHRQLAVDGAELGLPAEVGGVRRVDPSGREQVWPATPLTFFLEGVAARMIGASGAPDDRALLLRWVEAPRRRHTWALYRRAIAPRATAAPATAVAPAPASASAEAAPVADPVAAAVGAHVAALDAHACGRLGRADVAAAARAWDRALSSTDTRTAILARAIDVGAPPDAGHKVLDELARTAADDLATLILVAELPLDELRDATGTLGVVAQRVRHRLLGDLELAISRTAERVRARRALPAIDEWRELCALRAAHLRASRIGGDALRRLAFPHLHEELTPWLIWLWNDRHEHVLSDALTTWLLAEALAVGDTQAIELHAKNASLPLPARA